MLKIYVWREFAPDYTNGLAVAIAETVQEAQGLIVTELGWNPSDWGPCEEIPLGKFVAACPGGA